MKNLTLVYKWLTLAGIACSGVLFSASSFANDVVIDKGYIRATIPGTNISSAYMDINNHSAEQVVFVGASSDVSDRIEIHQHTMENGMMRMRQRDSLVIKGHDMAVLQPSGYHLMIFNLNKPLKVDEKIKLTLHFSQADDVEITLPVQSIKREKSKKQAHQHHH